MQTGTQYNTRQKSRRQLECEIDDHMEDNPPRHFHEANHTVEVTNDMEADICDITAPTKEHLHCGNHQGSIPNDECMICELGHTVDPYTNCAVLAAQAQPHHTETLPGGAPQGSDTAADEKLLSDHGEEADRASNHELQVMDRNTQLPEGHTAHTRIYMPNDKEENMLVDEENTAHQSAIQVVQEERDIMIDVREPAQNTHTCPPVSAIMMRPTLPQGEDVEDNSRRTFAISQNQRASRRGAMFESHKHRLVQYLSPRAARPAPVEGEQPQAARATTVPDSNAELTAPSSPAAAEPPIVARDATTAMSTFRALFRQAPPAPSKRQAKPSITIPHPVLSPLTQHEDMALAGPQQAFVAPNASHIRPHLSICTEHLASPRLPPRPLTPRAQNAPRPDPGHLPEPNQPTANVQEFVAIFQQAKPAKRKRPTPNPDGPAESSAPKKQKQCHTTVNEPSPGQQQLRRVSRNKRKATHDDDTPHPGPAKKAKPTTHESSYTRSEAATAETLRAYGATHPP